jgi:hypothetical protein
MSSPSEALLAGFNLVTLPREFFSQFFLGWQIQHIFRGKHLLALVQCGVPGHDLILLRAQDQADGWIASAITQNRVFRIFGEEGRGEPWGRVQ